MRWMLGLALATYPLAVYLLVDRVDGFWLLLALCLLLAARLWMMPLSRRQRALGMTALAGFCFAALLVSQLTLLKLYPVLINAAALVFTVYTLVVPPSAIARLMQAMRVEVSAAGVIYTRRLTTVWAVFFAFNTLAAGGTALYGSTQVWAWYNGAVSYALIGLLVLVEWPVRRAYQKRHAEASP